MPGRVRGISPAHLDAARQQDRLAHWPPGPETSSPKGVVATDGRIRGETLLRPGSFAVPGARADFGRADPRPRRPGIGSRTRMRAEGLEPPRAEAHQDLNL